MSRLRASITSKTALEGGSGYAVDGTSRFLGKEHDVVEHYDCLQARRLELHFRSLAALSDRITAPGPALEASASRYQSG